MTQMYKMLESGTRRTIFRVNDVLLFFFVWNPGCVLGLASCSSRWFYR